MVDDAPSGVLADVLGAVASSNSLAVQLCAAAVKGEQLNTQQCCQHHLDLHEHGFDRSQRWLVRRGCSMGRCSAAAVPDC